MAHPEISVTAFLQRQSPDHSHQSDVLRKDLRHHRSQAVPQTWLVGSNRSPHTMLPERPDLLDCRFKEGVQSLPQLLVVLGAMSKCHGMAAKLPLTSLHPSSHVSVPSCPVLLPQWWFLGEPGRIRPQWSGCSYLHCPSSSSPFPLGSSQDLTPESAPL